MPFTTLSNYSVILQKGSFQESCHVTLKLLFDILNLKTVHYSSTHIPPSISFVMLLATLTM